MKGRHLDGGFCDEGFWLHTLVVPGTLGCFAEGENLDSISGCEVCGFSFSELNSDLAIEMNAPRDRWPS